VTRFKVLRSAQGLALEDRFSRQKPLLIDFEHPDFVRRLKKAGKKSELVVQAVRPEPGLKVVDCTAGLGTDAFILAWLGCEVQLIERSPVLHALLQDAIDRARVGDVVCRAAGRLHLVQGDAMDLLQSDGAHYEAAYLDPMFPEKSGSAMVKGGMQMLQRFLGADEDAQKLLVCAMESGVGRTVLKRPPRSDWEPPRKPDHVFRRRNAHLEVYRS